MLELRAVEHKAEDNMPFVAWDRAYAADDHVPHRSPGIVDFISDVLGSEVAAEVYDQGAA